MVSNHQLWEMTDQVDVKLEIRRRRYGWIDHTLRKDEKEVCHRALELNPKGRGKPGRPKTMLRRTVLKECGRNLLVKYDL